MLAAPPNFWKHYNRRFSNVPGEQWKEFHRQNTGSGINWEFAAMPTEIVVSLTLCICNRV